MTMRKGDFNLSFNMILSIIIIASVVAVAAYTISYFIEVKECSDLGLFARDFQDSVDRAWNADIVEKEVFAHVLPGSVDAICLGNVSLGVGRPEYRELRIFSQRDANLFFYPRQDCELTHAKIEHLQLDGFKCLAVEDGRFSVELNKGSFDALVRLS